jgi:Ca-activated chloride channel family protein
MTFRSRCFTAGLLVGLAAMQTHLVASDVPRLKVKDLPQQWRVWLEEEVYPLITQEQRKAFLALQTDAQRSEFVERLWDIWGSQTEHGTGFRRLYQDRLEECRSEFGSTTDDRARVLLLHGRPDYRKQVDCQDVFNPLDIWVWARLQGAGQNVVILFYQPWGLGRYRLWDPSMGQRKELYSTMGNMALSAWQRGSNAGQQLFRPEYRCADGEEIIRLIGMAEYWMRDNKVRAMMDHMLPPPTTRGGESASERFLEFSTLVPAGTAPVEFEVGASVGARRGGKMTVDFSSRVASAGLKPSKVGEVDVVQLDVTGEISRENAMVDRFRYTFTFPIGSKDFPIQIEREFRPGHYTLRLKIEDINSKHAGVKEIEFDVAEPEVAAPTAEEQAAEQLISKLATTPEATLALNGPEGEGVTGVQRFTAMVGPKVAKVEFSLNGKLVMTKNRAPFEVELDLGALPRLASVQAIAFSANGDELDRKQVELNVGRERFLARLQPVSAVDRSGGKVRAAVTVNVPPERKLSKLELYWNETLMATLYGPPFSAWLPVQDDGSIGYLRALATLDDGSQAEDVTFVNAPQFLTGVRVETVELPVTVLDKGSKPVEGLKQAEFEVLEDGKPQKISHFSLQRELPIRLGLVIDTSGSMEATLPEVQRVVSGFLRNFLRPKDRASVVAFSNRAALLEGFTADFGALERALIALRADRETALYDATVFGLFQFSGVRGRKAMILLSDGEDNASRMDYNRVLDYARRSGVTIYVIGIDLPITRVMIRSQLNRLTEATGGSVFYLQRASSLEPVYEQINRELRTQYLLAYTSSSEGPVDAFRKIVVKVARRGLEVRTLAGYYPGG